MIPKTDTLSKGTKVPGIKSSLFEVLVEEAPESNTIGKLSESNRNIFFLFNEVSKIRSYFNCSAHTLRFVVVTLS